MRLEQVVVGEYSSWVITELSTTHHSTLETGTKRFQLVAWRRCGTATIILWSHITVTAPEVATLYAPLRLFPPAPAYPPADVSDYRLSAAWTARIASISRCSTSASVFGSSSTQIKPARQALSMVTSATTMSSSRSSPV